MQLSKPVNQSEPGRSVAHDVIFRLRPRNLTRDPWDLATGRSLIGRGPGCTLPLDEDGIADQHCLLLAGPRRLVVKALSPFTWLNDGTFREAVCVPGDRLTIGPVEFIIEAFPLPTTQPEQNERVLTKRTIEELDATSSGAVTELQQQISASRPTRSLPATFDELTSLLDQYFAHRDISATADGSAEQRHGVTSPASIASVPASVDRSTGSDRARPGADVDAVRVWEQELDQLAASLAEQAASHWTREGELAERSRELAEQVREFELQRQRHDQQEQLLRARQQQLDARDSRLSERELDCQRLADDLQQLQSQQNARAGELQQLWQQLSEREHSLQKESEAGAIQARAVAKQLAEIRELQLAVSMDREQLEVDQRELASQQQALAEQQAQLLEEQSALEAEQVQLAKLQRELTGRATELDIQEAALTERLHDLQQRESLLLASRNQLTAAREAWTLEQQLHQQGLTEQKNLLAAQQQLLAAREAEFATRAEASSSHNLAASSLLSLSDSEIPVDLQESSTDTSQSAQAELTQLHVQVEQLQQELSAIQLAWEESRSTLSERLQERDALLEERDQLWEQLQRAADSAAGKTPEQEPAAADAELLGLLEQREVELQQREAELQQLQELCSALELRLEQYASRGDRAEQELRRRETELRDWEAQLIEREAELNEIWQELQTSKTEPHLDHEEADPADAFRSELQSRRSFTHADPPEITEYESTHSDQVVVDESEESLHWESEIEQRLRVADPEADDADEEDDHWSATDSEQTASEEFDAPSATEHNSLRLQLAEMFGLPAESLRQLQSAEESSESLQSLEDEAPEADQFLAAEDESPEAELTPEDPIAAYMERLLARSRRQEEAPIPETIQLDTGKPKPAGTAVAVLPPAEEKSLLNPLPVERAMPQPLENKPRKLGVEERDALRANLDSFRELANLSARSAVARSQSNRLQGSIQIHQYLTVAAWIATVTLLSSTLWMNSTYLLPGVLALAGALALSWRTLMLWLELKKQENIPIASFEGIEPADADDAG